MNQLLLHVMIPAYGSSPYLEETLKSIPNEYFKFSKFTVVEDPSDSNNISTIMKNYPQISYHVNKVRLGIAGNFNKCLELSEGVFTQICGSDDVLSSKVNFGSVYKQLSDGNDKDIIINKVEIIGKSGLKKLSLTDLVKFIVTPKKIGKISCKDFMASIALGDWVYFPSIYWKTATFKNLKFSNEFHTAMDLEIFYQSCRKGLTIHIFDSKNLFYRRHKDSASVLYSNDVARFEEEFKCQALGKIIAKEKGWRNVELYLDISLGIRLHILMKFVRSLIIQPQVSFKYFGLIFKRIK